MKEIRQTPSPTLNVREATSFAGFSPYIRAAPRGFERKSRESKLSAPANGSEEWRERETSESDFHSLAKIPCDCRSSANIRDVYPTRRGHCLARSSVYIYVHIELHYSSEVRVDGLQNSWEWADIYGDISPSRVTPETQLTLISTNQFTTYI